MLFDQTWGSDAGAALPVAIEVLRHGPISRAEIGRRLGLSHASLSRLSAPLIERGVIVDVGERNEGKVGRPSRLLDVDPSSHHFLGLKIREREIIAAVTDLRGEVVADHTLELDDHEPADVVRRVSDIHAAFAKKHTITGIGVGIGGAVRDRRTVTSARFLGWHDVELAGLIEAATGTPALVENDVVAICEYEDWFGFARHDDRFAVITLGIGTGFGLVIGGSAIVNDDYGIGLIGHWPMNPAGPLCPQGHRGCADALLTIPAIERYASETRGERTTFVETMHLAATGIPWARRLVTDAAQGLAVLIAAISNLTLPQRIIIAGEGVRLASLGMDALLNSVRELRPAEASTPPIDLATGDNIEWARGAAVLAIQAFALGTV